MAKEKLAETVATDSDIMEKQPAPQKQKIAVEIEVPESETFIVCQICGHKNRKDQGLCAMCSNYLFNEGGENAL